MGLLGMFSLIPAMQGNIGMSLCMMGLDFLTDRREEKEAEERRQIEAYNRQFAISPNEMTLFLGWAVGEDVMALLIANPDFAATQECHECLISFWNEQHGNTLRLYPENGPSHNVHKMMKLWINLGKP